MISAVHADACKSKNVSVFSGDFNGDGSALQDQLLASRYGQVIIGNDQCIRIMTSREGPSYAEYPRRPEQIEQTVVVQNFRNIGPEKLSDILSVDLQFGGNHLYATKGGTIEPEFERSSVDPRIFNRHHSVTAKLIVGDFVADDDIMEVFACWNRDGQHRLVSLQDPLHPQLYNTQIPEMVDSEVSVGYATEIEDLTFHLRRGA
jgi:hypothetical protein